MSMRPPYYSRNGKVSRYVNADNDLIERDLYQLHDRVVDENQQRVNRVPIDYPHGKRISLSNKTVVEVKQVAPEQAMHIMVQAFTSALDAELAGDSLMSVEEHNSCKAYLQAASVYLYRILDKLDYRENLK